MAFVQAGYVFECVVGCIQAGEGLRKAFQAGDGVVGYVESA
jgi:hypothetical protein